ALNSSKRESSLATALLQNRATEIGQTQPPTLLVAFHRPQIAKDMVSLSQPWIAELGQRRFDHFKPIVGRSDAECILAFTVPFSQRNSEVDVKPPLSGEPAQQVRKAHLSPIPKRAFMKCEEIDRIFCQLKRADKTFILIGFILASCRERQQDLNPQTDD